MNLSERGATLLEILIAVALVVTTVSMISVLFPNASSAITNNRRHWIANNFAVSRLQQLKDQPYPNIDPTPPTAGNFPNSGIATAGAGGCDCLKDIDNLAPDSTYTEDGIIYTARVCINLVDRVGTSWNTYCPDNPLTSNQDKGLKDIHIRVTWPPANASAPVDVESLVSR
jgi:hypothetical protein